MEAAQLRWLDFSTNQINIRVIFLQQNLSLCSSWRVDLMCGWEVKIHPQAIAYMYMTVKTTQKSI